VSENSKIQNLQAASIGIFTLILVIAAAIGLGGYILSTQELSHWRGTPTSQQSAPMMIPGNSLTMRMGVGINLRNETLRITGLSDEGRALATRGVNIDASDYRFLSYDLGAHHPGETVYFVWRSADRPAELSSKILHVGPGQKVTIDLTKHDLWKGEITEVGLDIYGSLRGSPLSVSLLTLHPESPTALLSAILSEWTVFRSWTQKSAHLQRGTPDWAILPPTLAAAAWAGLTLLLLALAYRQRLLRHPAALTGAILLPWVSLDLLWQANLVRQVEESRYLFGGKSHHDKHLADWNSNLYLYAAHLKNKLPAQPGARIFLLHDSEHRTYTRLRAQYYLLPHNIYNYDRYPDKKSIRSGDYILALGSIPGLTYSRQEQLLSWQDRSRHVQLIDEHVEGTLYQVTDGAN
jgi:hypothetical protein